MQQVNLYIKGNVYHNLVVGNVSDKDLIQMQFYNTDIILEKGIDNTIQFSIRDHDRKCVTLKKTQSLVFTMINNELQQKFEKTLGVINASTGKYFVLITDDELNDLDCGVFTAHVSIVTTVDGVDVLEDVTYSGNEWYPFFNVTVKPNRMSLTSEPVTKDSSDFKAENYVVDNETKQRYVSSAIPSNVTSSHTLQITLEDDFIGQLILQGTLDSNPSSSDTAWVNLLTKTIEPESEEQESWFTNPILMNVVYNCLYIRLTFIKDLDSTPVISKFTYRN